MGLIDRARQAFHKAVQRHNGKLIRLQEQTGVNYSIINRLNSGKNNFNSMTLQTFEKLFPELEVSFFRDERVASETTDPRLRELLSIWDNLSTADKLRVLAAAYDCLETGIQVDSDSPPGERTATKHAKAG